MLLTITYKGPSATDLGFLVQKHPARVRTVTLSFGLAHVFFPEAEENRCTCALLLDVDPVRLVRGQGRRRLQGLPLQEYINDRPYVASSFLSVAISSLFRTALTGVSVERPELAKTPLSLEAKIAVLSSVTGEALLRSLFEPLGYAVTLERHSLDRNFPEWGEGPYFTVTLQGTILLRDLLRHLYVLIPVLDDEKHYWVGEDEVEKLLRHGEGWLASHPLREEIATRYLKHQPGLTNLALAQLMDEDQLDPDTIGQTHSAEEERVESPMHLAELRVSTTSRMFESWGAKRVLDLGCGEGRLLTELLKNRAFEQIVGVDVSSSALETARRRLRFDELSPRLSSRIRLLQGSLAYKDDRLAGFDACAVLEVIEHLEPYRLDSFERVVFEFARPRKIVITTPNLEYNVKFLDLPAGKYRHKDHRFEWTRAEFETWARAVAGRFGFSVSFQPIGPEDPTLGPPTQMGVFEL